MSKTDPLTRLSKFLSLVLRHKPEEIGLQLDPGGWAVVQELLDKLPTLTRELLDQIVQEDGKQRYSFSPDGTRIRAVQGHSIPVDLGLEPKEPPAVLYHGTARRFLAQIQQRGLLSMGRQFVHLSAEVDTAKQVGARHGDPVVLAVDARAMHQNQQVFYLAENGVWLTSYVDAQYLKELP